MDIATSRDTFCSLVMMLRLKSVCFFSFFSIFLLGSKVEAFRLVKGSTIQIVNSTRCFCGLFLCLDFSDSSFFLTTRCLATIHLAILYLALIYQYIAHLQWLLFLWEWPKWRNSYWCQDFRLWICFAKLFSSQTSIFIFLQW